MAQWRCPHCSAPQPETARCWVCRRSTTTCDTCRHWRRGVAGTLGYCGLDRRRLPLLGDEIRGCWEAGPPEPAAGPALAAGAETRGFVPVEPVAPRPPAPIATDPPRWSLWAEAD